MTGPAGRARRGPLGLAPVLLFLLGLALRLMYYAGKGELWNDEVLIALNLRTHSFGELFAPLDYGQTIPVVHLVAAKAAASLLGHHELAYRLPMLLGSIVLLWLAWRFLPRVMDRVEALILLAFLAVYHPLVYFAAELKQYGLDAAATVALLIAALRFLQGEPDPKAWRRLAIWGLGALVLSQPAVFTIAGIIIALLVDARARRMAAWRARSLAVTSLWVAAGLLLFITSYRRSVDDAYMQRFWDEYFLAPGEGWLTRMLDAIWVFSGAENLPGMRVAFLGLLAGIGLCGIWRRYGLSAAALLITPPAAVAAAAFFRAYPIAERLVLFTVPLLLWGFSSAIVTLARSLRPLPGTIAGALLFTVIWLPAAMSATRFAIRPPPIEPTGRIVERVAQDPDALVMVLFGGYFGWAHYAGDWRAPARLAENTRRFYRCETTVPVPSGCQQLVFRGHQVGDPALIVLPPHLNSEAADEAWIAEHSGRALDGAGRVLWVLASTYPQRYSARRLIERLLERLEAAGAVVEPAESLGLSVLSRVTLPRMAGTPRR